MPDDKLGIKQRAAMLVLMAEARPVRNPDLKRLAGFDLNRKEREDLNARDLVRSRWERRAHVHQLTEQGLQWCTEELSAPLPARAGSAGGALYALLAGIGRFLSSSGLRLTDVFQPAEKETTEQAELENRIRTAYRRLAKEPGAWVRLAALRHLLDSAPRTDVDAALRRMNHASEVSIVPEPNQKTLSDEDRAAAVRVGGRDKHLLSIGQT